jgi:hypothetical protein
MPQPTQNIPARTPLVLWAAAGAFLLVVVLLVGMTLRRPEPLTFAPSPVQLRPAGDRLVGPEVVTVDATDGARWQYFSFAHGSVIDRPGPLDWDLALRRFQVITNGGAGFAGTGGVIDLGDVPFDSVAAVPQDGYSGTRVRSDSVNLAMRRWYAYSYASHLLSPKPHVYALRTADGRYAKLQFVGYYCPGATPGCVTFRYVYQGAGGMEFVGDAANRDGG